MLGRNPVLWMGLFTAIILTAKEFGLQEWLTPSRELAVNTLIIAVMSWLTRSQVTPAVTVREDPSRALRDNGINPSTLKPIAQAVLLFVVAVPLALSAACGLRGKPAERQVALIGIQVVDGLTKANLTARDLHSQKVLTDGQYKAFLQASDRAFDQAQVLAQALRAYDQAASHETATQVQGALNALAVLVPQVGAAVTGPNGQKIAELVGEVNKLLIAIAQAVSPPAPTPPAESIQAIEPARARALPAQGRFA